MLLRQSDSTCKCGMDMCACNCLLYIMQERVEQAEQAQEELSIYLFGRGAESKTGEQSTSSSEQRN